MSSYLSNSVQGAGTGAAAGGSVGGGFGALIGGLAGLGAGLLGAYEESKTTKEKRKALQNIANEVGKSEEETQKMLDEYYSGDYSVGTKDDVTKYRNLVDNYNPEDYVYDYEDFDTDAYDVNDYYATNKDAIIKKTADTTQATAAGNNIGRGTGAANQIATNVADKNEDLYKDALEAMNSDRTFDYNVWNSTITNGQNRLNQLANLTNTQLTNYGNLATNYTDAEADKVQAYIDANNNSTQNKITLGTAMASI